MSAAGSVTLSRVLDFLAGRAIAVEGRTDRTVTRPAPIHQADSSDCITFCGKGHAEGVALIRDTRAGVVLCSPELELTPAVGEDRTFIVVAEPRLEFLRVVGAFFEPGSPAGIHPTAVVHPDAVIDPTAHVGPFSYVGACEIGAQTVLLGHAHLHDGTRVGSEVIVHPGAMIGVEGFGYERTASGALERFPHIGGVLIEDRVVIGAGCCIARGTLGDTIIGEGTKLDNLVHVAHNVRIGKHTLIVANAMIAGSSVIGDRVWIGPGAQISDHVNVGDDASVTLGAVVVRDVRPGQKVSGNFATDHLEFLLASARRGHRTGHTEP
jgi:UDP-3-O-[3-hydroxymyristoyl] glucosamine N-acyltransferase